MAAKHEASSLETLAQTVEASMQSPEVERISFLFRQYVREFLEVATRLQVAEHQEISQIARRLCELSRELCHSAPRNNPIPSDFQQSLCNLLSETVNHLPEDKDELLDSCQKNIELRVKDLLTLRTYQT